MITLGQTESDNINRMITIKDDFYLVIFNKWHVQMGKVVNVKNFNVDTSFVGNFFQANEGLVTKNC